MLFRSVTITDLHSPHHGETLDVRVTDGTVERLAPDVPAQKNETVIEGENLHLSPGFVDIGAYLGEPGHEEREDIESLVNAARSGGYVAVAVLPESDPVRQSAADLAFLTAGNGQRAVDLLPLAAVSRNLAGKDLTEMLELAKSGAVGFTDGPHAEVSSSLLKRALEYAGPTQLPLFVTPNSRKLAAEGQLHEGTVSVALGMQGVPTLSESIPLFRNEELRKYTGGHLVHHLVTTAAGLHHLGGDAGTKVFATAGVHHLSFTVAELTSFDPNFKMMPPLREENDRQALVDALADGRISAVVSNHRARHGEEKDLEFYYSAFGARGLETTFRQLLALTGATLTLDRAVEALTHGPRALLGLPPLTVKAGAPAALTLFSTAGSSVFEAADLGGKTTNSPLLGRELPGRIVGTVNHQRYYPA